MIDAASHAGGALDMHFKVKEYAAALTSSGSRLSCFRRSRRDRFIFLICLEISGAYDQEQAARICVIYYVSFQIDMIVTAGVGRRATTLQGRKRLQQLQVIQHGSCVLQFPEGSGGKRGIHNNSESHDPAPEDCRYGAA